MTDEHIMPIAISRRHSWIDRAFSASELSSLEWFAIGAGTLGFSVQILASVFHNSAFSLVVRSDLGTILATINAVSVAAAIFHHILRKERADRKELGFSSPPMPDSKEAESEKISRIRRRREGH